jgi:hypothetical protein
MKISSRKSVGPTTVHETVRVYLALASERGCRFVTADARFVRKLAEGRRRRFRGRVISSVQAAGEPDNATRN